VLTNAQGQFVISNAPFGYYKLMADGSTATVTNESFPTIEYDMVTVAGQDNSVGTPIYLPALDTVDQLCVDATHGGTLTLPQQPGFSLTVLPGSATFPGGSKTGCVSVSMVNADKMPMPPGFGQQPRFIVTIQPVGTTFNPPAPMTLPNTDGLLPRHVTEMYSYDHDLSMFVAIGTGTVSADGSVVASDPGVGVLKAGWHCCGDPNFNGATGDCGQCKVCTGTQCVNTQNGTGCGAPQSGSYALSFNNGANTVNISLGAACFASTCQTGSCSPPANGFNPQVLKDALTDVLGRIYDNNGSCLESTLQHRMQMGLAQHPNTGLLIDCMPTPPDEPTLCGEESNVGVNHVILYGNAFTWSGCGSTAAVLMHELVHSLANDPGDPDGGYHNSNLSAGAPDCRDRPYGCEKQCYNFGNGNDVACELPPAQIQSAINANDGASVACGNCKSVSFTYTVTDANHNKHTVADTQIVCSTVH
jgi:hypothetical protein